MVTKEIILQAIQESDFILTPTHNKLCLPIIDRIYKKMKIGIKFDDIKVCDSVLIDGHHRYLGSVVAKMKLDEAKSLKSCATTEFDWTAVEFVNEDWDTEEKIQQLIEEDAFNNNISMEKITACIT